MSASEDNDDRIAQIMKKLYLEPIKADVYFVIESTGERIPAHKIILSGASDVFEAMFYGPLKEEGDIKIIDASAESFKEFLQFCYFNKVEPSLENIAEVMYLVQKYGVMNGLSLCANFLTTKMTIENVISFLNLAIIYDQKELFQTCELEISSHSCAVLKSPDFLTCDRMVLNKILEMKRFSCPLTDVVEACMSWVRVTSGEENLTRDIIQNHLGDLFYKIPFGSMSHDEFANLLPTYGELFSAAEFNELFQLMSKIQNQPKIFKSRYKNVLECDRSSLDKKKYPVQSVEDTSFSTNLTLLLENFEFVPLFDNEGEEVDSISNVRVTILANSNEIQSQFCFDYVSGTYLVVLPKTVIIKPGIIYNIQLAFPSIDCYTGRAFESTVNLEQGIIVTFHNNRAVDGEIVGVIDLLGFSLLESYDLTNCNPKDEYSYALT